MVGDNIWMIVGVALVAWVGWDIYAGYTYAHRLILRADEPGLYWTFVVLWALIAAWCLGLLSLLTSN